MIHTFTTEEPAAADAAEKVADEKAADEKGTDTAEKPSDPAGEAKPAAELVMDLSSKFI